MKVTTTQLLDFFSKVQTIGAPTHVNKIDGGYEVIVDWDWTGTHFYSESFVITDKGVSTTDGRDHDFAIMDELIDQFVKEHEEKELKMRKRKEVLSRLTDEEKELLGLSS